MTRVKSLVRLKMLTDELRLRAIHRRRTSASKRCPDVATSMQQNPTPKILLVDDRRSS